MEPHSLVEERGKVVISVGAWPAASKTNASWPAHRLGGLGTWVGILWEKAESNRSIFRFFLLLINHFSRPPELVGGP